MKFQVLFAVGTLV